MTRDEILTLMENCYGEGLMQGADHPYGIDSFSTACAAEIALVNSRFKATIDSKVGTLPQESDLE